MKKPKTRILKGWSPADFKGKISRYGSAFTVSSTKREALWHAQVTRRVVRVEVKVLG